MLLEIKLNDLMDKGCLKSWKLEDIDENGNIGQGRFRNTERLTLEFPSGDKLMLGTFCSGSSEDTGFVLDDSE